MEYFETAAYAHARLRESIEDSLLELAGRVERRSQINICYIFLIATIGTKIKRSMNIL